MASVWERDLSTGVESMDDEHLALMGVLSTLRTAVASGQGTRLALTLLTRLDAEVRDHFAAEERQMAALRYPMADSHIAQHQKFLDGLDDLRLRCGEGDLGMTMHLVDFVETWFVRHVEIADKPLADWILARRAPAAARVVGAGTAGTRTAGPRTVSDGSRR